jgi:hypothetical protein
MTSPAKKSLVIYDPNIVDEHGDFAILELFTGTAAPYADKLAALPVGAVYYEASPPIVSFMTAPKSSAVELVTKAPA